MIRQFENRDISRALEIHEENGLPDNCFPNLDDPLFIVKLAVEHDGKPVMASFLKGTSELFLIVDHNAGTPEERWEWLQQLTDEMKSRAYALGLDGMTCWVPPEIEQTFSKRLLELGFVRSPWQSYTMPIE